MASLTVYDVTGKVMHRIENQYPKGYNEILLQKSDLGAGGVLYYSLETEGFTATKKMIGID